MYGARDRAHCMRHKDSCKTDEGSPVCVGWLRGTFRAVHPTSQFTCSRFRAEAASMASASAFRRRTPSGCRETETSIVSVHSTSHAHAYICRLPLG